MTSKDKRTIQESYDDLGGRLYDIRYKEEQEAKYRILLNQVRPHAYDIVLDDGCGTGLLLQRFTSHSVGLDLSSKLLSAARLKLGERTNTYLVNADSDQLPFRSSTFTKVFAVTLIQNLPEPEQTLGEIKRVSQPDSIIVVSGLKKSYSFDNFEDILENSGLFIEKLILDEELKDWLAYATV